MSGLDQTKKAPTGTAWPRKIALQYPPMLAEGQIQELTMRRAKVADFLSASDGGDTNSNRNEVALFAALCGVDAGVIEALDMADYAELQAVFTEMQAKK